MALVSAMASPASSGAPVERFRVRARALRPVAARIVSYGREPRRPATLYVIRAAQSGDADWFVARRYSEFRALHEALARLLLRPGAHACASCAELAAFFPALRFPERHRLQARFAFSKRKMEAQRMDELNHYLRSLVGATRGLLEEDEDEDDDDDCVAFLLIREFLMTGEFSEQRADVDANLRDDVPAELNVADNCHTNASSRSDPTVPSHQKSLRLRHRLCRRGSSMSSIPAHELDLVVAGDDRHALSPMSNPTFADVFDDVDLLPQDACIHRQVPESDLVGPLRLIESFPRR